MVFLPRHNIVPRIISGLVITYHPALKKEAFFARPEGETVFVICESQPGVLVSVSVSVFTEINVPMLTWGQHSFMSLVCRQAMLLQKQRVNILSYKGEYGALLCNGDTTLTYR